MEQMNIKHFELDNVDKPKPFKLCFVDKGVVGRSNIIQRQCAGLGPVVASKFYDKHYHDIDEQLVEKYKSLLISKETLKKSTLPQSENQKYGWYQVRLTDADLSDRRLYAHKRTNIIIKEHLMNYAKIRE